MALVMHPEAAETCPRTPDRFNPFVALVMPEAVIAGASAVAPLGSPLLARLCGTPCRQFPLKSPASSNAPMTGCSGATPARGVATPVRSCRRRTFAAPQKEYSAPTPRALTLCDCGHCPACVPVGMTIINQGDQSAALSSFPATKRGIICLSDLACPGPSSPGPSPSAFDDALQGLENMELVQEIPICATLPNFSQALNECVCDPRKRQRQVSLPVLVIPTSASCMEVPAAAAMGKASDPGLHDNHSSRCQRPLAVRCLFQIGSRPVKEAIILILQLLPVILAGAAGAQESSLPRALSLYTLDTRGVQERRYTWPHPASGVCHQHFRSAQGRLRTQPRRAALGVTAHPHQVQTSQSQMYAVVALRPLGHPDGNAQIHRVLPVVDESHIFTSAWECVSRRHA